MTAFDGFTRWTLYFNKYLIWRKQQRDTGLSFVFQKTLLNTKLTWFKSWISHREKSKVSVGRGQEHIFRNHNSSDTGGCCYFNCFIPPPLALVILRKALELTAACSFPPLTTANFCSQATESGHLSRLISLLILSQNLKMTVRRHSSGRHPILDVWQPPPAPRTSGCFASPDSSAAKAGMAYLWHFTSQLWACGRFHCFNLREA